MLFKTNSTYQPFVSDERLILFLLLEEWLESETSENEYDSLNCIHFCFILLLAEIMREM